jgi:hypothetical protein
MTVAVLAIDRMDTWVLKVSIAIPVVCVAGLLLWHVVAYLAGKLAGKRKAVRLAAEPRPPLYSPQRLSGDQALARAITTEAQVERARRARELLALAREDFSNQRFPGCLDRCQVLDAAFPDLPEAADARQLAVQIKNDPERLQRACAVLTESLAALYLELAESWLRQGQPRQAAAAWHKLIQSCPETPQAQVARDRLRQSGAEQHS